MIVRIDAETLTQLILDHFKAHGYEVKNPGDLRATVRDLCAGVGYAIQCVIKPVPPSPLSIDRGSPPALPVFPPTSVFYGCSAVDPAKGMSESGVTVTHVAPPKGGNNWYHGDGKLVVERKPEKRKRRAKR